MAGKVSKKLKYKRKAETLKQAIGAVVTQLRIERNWPQAELSVRSGYGRPWISQLENGKVNPRLELIIAFADTFNLTLSQFFARAERKHLKRKAAAPAKLKKSHRS
ncbi:MAG TPA: helix-turn-helix domain-containing protein [Candidatus Angelobacter sp.]|nr:helix-turn-helix domain-containing protein [Candidatus Angelobacter sp.]